MGRNSKIRCPSCDRPMEVLKNGFYFVLGKRMYTSDLYGCSDCHRFQFRGVNPSFASVAVCHLGDLEEDEVFYGFLKVPDPDFDFPEKFDEWLEKYYPHWDL